jgi:hypothetical protein
VKAHCKISIHLQMSKILKHHIFLYIFVNNTYWSSSLCIPVPAIFVIGMYFYIQSMLHVVSATYFVMDSIWYLILSTEYSVADWSVSTVGQRVT